MESNMSFEILMPSKEDRRIVSTFLKKDLDYLRVWHKNNSSWEVTNRYDIDRIRINFGKCYILDVLYQELHILLYKNRLSKAFIIQNEDRMTPVDFYLINEGVFELNCKPSFLKEHESEIMKGHRVYLDKVIETSTKSPYIASYYPQFIEDINEEFNLKIPHPDYFDGKIPRIESGKEPILSKEEYEKIKRILLSKRWIYAKTMPDHPHWYTLRKEWEKDEEFIYVVNAIRQYGYTEKFYNKDYTRLDIEDMKYWTMGAPVDETILINRAFIKK